MFYLENNLRSQKEGKSELQKGLHKDASCAHILPLYRATLLLPRGLCGGRAFLWESAQGNRRKVFSSWVLVFSSPRCAPQQLDSSACLVEVCWVPVLPRASLCCSVKQGCMPSQVSTANRSSLFPFQDYPLSEGEAEVKKWCIGGCKGTLHCKLLELTQVYQCLIELHARSYNVMYMQTMLLQFCKPSVASSLATGNFFSLPFSLHFYLCWGMSINLGIIV